jgi:hypothetical protein
MQGKYDEAIQAFDESIQINPQDALTREWKGIGLNLLNRTTDKHAGPDGSDSPLMVGHITQPRGDDALIQGEF